MNVIRLIRTLILLTAVPLYAHGQSRDWYTARYDMSKGLPQSSVQRVAIDSLGYAWLSTEAGLVRFDGMMLRYMPSIRDSKGNEDRMRDILRTYNGGLIAADVEYNRFSVLSEHIVIPIAEHYRSPIIHGGLPAMETFVRIFDPSVPIAHRDKWPDFDMTMLPLNAHEWCVLAGDSLLWYYDLRFVRAQPLPTGIRYLTLFGRDLYAIDSDGYSYCSRDNRGPFRPCTSSDRVPAGVVRWRSGDKEAVVCSDRTFSLLRPRPDGLGLSVEPLPVAVPDSSIVFDAAWDRINDQLLVGTSNYGLMVFRRAPTSLLTHTVNGNIIGGTGYQAVIGRDSVLVFGSGQKALICTGEGCSYAPGFDRCWGFSGGMDQDGNLYHAGGVDGTALYKYSPRTKSSTEVVQCGAAINCIFPEGETIWIGTVKGIDRYENGTRTQVLDHLDGAAPFGVIFIRRGPHGDLWYGTNTGLYYLDAHGRSFPYSPLDGRCVRYMENLDGLWCICTYGDGAYILGDSLLRLPLDPEHALIHTHAAILGGHDRLWLSTNQGLVRTEWSAVRRWVNDRSVPIRYEFIGCGSTFKSAEFNGGCGQSYARLPNGLTYFPTLDGVLRVWLDSIEAPLHQPSGLVFEDIIVDGTS